MDTELPGAQPSPPGAPGPMGKPGKGQPSYFWEVTCGSPPWGDGAWDGLHIHAGGDGRGGEGCSGRRELQGQEPGLVRAWSPERRWPTGAWRRRVFSCQPGTLSSYHVSGPPPPCWGTDSAAPAALQRFSPASGGSHGAQHTWHVVSAQQTLAAGQEQR